MTERSKIGDMYLRQQEIFDQTKAAQPITVIGAGSLGSWLVLGLAKLGFSDITVFDDDIVELHNIPSQFYNMINADGIATDGEAETKVMALHNNINLFTDIRIKIHPERFERQPLKGLVIVTPDNMATRKSVFLRCVDNMNVPYFIDGRMGGQTYKIYAVNPNNAADAQYYLRHWHSDEEGSPEPCTARGVGYNAAMCAMEMVNVAKRVAMGQDVPKEIIYDSGGMWREVAW